MLYVVDVFKNSYGNMVVSNLAHAAASGMGSKSGFATNGLT